MFSIYLYSFSSVIIVSLVSLVGIFTIALKEQAVKKYIFIFISLAIGALIGDAFIHLIPQAMDLAGDHTSISIMVIAGILVFFILEKGLHWHHLHHLETEEESAIHPTGKMLLVSDGIHNFIDGIIIGISYLISVEVGIATTIAIVVHEIPQEVGDFAVLIHSGYTKAKAIWFNFLSALCAVIGTALALVLGAATETLIIWLIPLVAGGFIYIAMSDLIPVVHRTKNLSYSFMELLAMFAGVLAMILLLAVE